VELLLLVIMCCQLTTIGLCNAEGERYSLDKD
jgi:hypothetical protein